MTDLNTALLTEQDMAKLVAELKVAKTNKDIPALLNLYHPDCVLEQPGLGSYSQGHAEIGPALIKFVTHFPDYQREEAGAAKSEDTYISWGMAKVTLTGEFSGHTANGQQTSVMTFILFRFKNNKIIYEGHHWDLSIICQDSGVPVEAVTGNARST